MIEAHAVDDGGSMSDRSRDELVAALERRLGKAAQADGLADDYLKGVAQHALARTIGGASAPTSLTSSALTW